MIGYWINTLDDGFFPPQEFVGYLPLNVRRAVVRYLEQGDLLETYRGYSWCRFCGHPNGFREYTDGRWVWPEGLAHYVRDHGVILPEEFIRDVESGRPPLAKNQWEKAPPNVDFWKGWCGQRISPEYWSRVSDLKKELDARSEQIVRAKVEATEAKEGLSLSRCIWAGCENRAIKGRAECAFHILRRDQTGFVHSANELLAGYSKG